MSDSDEAMNAVTTKPDYTLVPPNALREVVHGFMDGTSKYARDDWKKLRVSNRIAAALRHIEDFRMGIAFDKDSGVHHLGLAAADLLMALENTGHLNDLRRVFPYEDRINQSET